MSDREWMRQAAREWARRSRADQGLGPSFTDQGVVGKILGMLKAAQDDS